MTKLGGLRLPLWRPLCGPWGPLVRLTAFATAACNVSKLNGLAITQSREHTSAAIVCAM